jgi:putative oxidoreductase
MTTTQGKKSWLLPLLSSNLGTNVTFQALWTFLRVMAGLLMIHNGLDKLADVEGFATNVVANAMGLPFPVPFTYMAAYAELIGAALLILGFLSRLAASVLLLTMVMAIYFHLRADGFVIQSFELATLYASCFAFFIVNGAGIFSLDTWLAHRLQ